MNEHFRTTMLILGDRRPKVKLSILGIPGFGTILCEATKADIAFAHVLAGIQAD
jgi:hypothetical protein